MSKFTLYSIDDEMSFKEIVKMQFEEVRLEALLEKLDRFIKAAGFAPKGTLSYEEVDPNTIDFEERFINFTFNFEKLLLTENIPKDLHEKLYELLREDGRKYER